MQAYKIINKYIKKGEKIYPIIDTYINRLAYSPDDYFIWQDDTIITRFSVKGYYATVSGETEIIIPKKCTEIAGGAFASDSYLITKMTIPQNVKILNGGALINGLGSLKKLIIFSSFDFIGVTASPFNDTLETLIWDNAIKIPESSFTGCSKLEYKIPTTIKEIGRYAFSGCKKIYCPNPDKYKISIGEYAFNDVGKLIYY